jgi:hypothetical protein
VLADSLKLDTNAPIVGLCVPYVHGKQHHDQFPEKVSHHSKHPLEHIHSNLHEVPCLTHTGFHYWLTLINDCTHYCWIYLLKKKNEALPVFKLFKAQVEKQYGYLICILQEDKGVNSLAMKGMHFLVNTRFCTGHTSAEQCCGVQELHSGCISHGSLE